MKPVRLQAGADGLVQVFHDERVHFELLSLDQLRQAMVDAQQELARLTDHIAVENPGPDHRQRMTWLFTPDYRRPDNLQGIFRWLYIVRVTRSVVAECKAEVVQAGTDVPHWVMQRLQVEGIVTVQSGAWKQHLKTVLLPLRDARDLIRFIVHSVKSTIKSGRGFVTSNVDNQPLVLVKCPAKGIEVRYGPLTERLKKAGYRVIFQNFDQEDHVRQEDDHWKIFPCMRSSDVFKACMDARHCRNRLIRTRKITPLELAGIEPAFLPSFYGLARRALQYRLWRKSLEQLGPPRAAISVSSLNKPFDRLHFQALKASGVPVCIVLPRPMTRLRPAEELVQADLNSPKTLPDHFIVRDNSARKRLQFWTIEASQISEGVPRVGRAAASQPGQTPDRTRVLILLPARESENLQLIQLVAEALPRKNSANSAEIFIKGHPNSGLRPSERDLAEKYLSDQWQDVSTKAIDALIHARTLAVTSSSTALIEAALSGAAALWAPWFSELALPQLEFMENTGEVAENRKTFVDRLAILVNDPAQLCRLANISYAQASQNYGLQTTIADAAINWLQALLSHKLQASISDCCGVGG
jgi:hypothetical protein